MFHLFGMKWMHSDTEVGESGSLYKKRIMAILARVKHEMIARGSESLWMQEKQTWSTNHISSLKQDLKNSFYLQK